MTSPALRVAAGASLLCLVAGTAGCSARQDAPAGAPAPRPTAGVTVLGVPEAAPSGSPVASHPAHYAATPGGIVLPDRAATPGAVDPAAGKDQVCAAGYTKGVHAPPFRDKKAVYDAYGVGETDHNAYRVDHLVPVTLGGTNAVANLWPQPSADGRGAKEKDRLELRLRELVCTGQLPLPTAQAALTGDWWAAFGTYVPAGDGA